MPKPESLLMRWMGNRLFIEQGELFSNQIVFTEQAKFKYSGDNLNLFVEMVREKLKGRQKIREFVFFIDDLRTVHICFYPVSGQITCGTLDDFIKELGEITCRVHFLDSENRLKSTNLEIAELFHELWTRDVGTPGYSKQRWRDFHLLLSLRDINF
ncbi:MAG: hypothetical protein K1Y36_28565 [Blastocatellia bacterium]|nr:hypothetical protein [Blastocatellia bacterium]